MDKPTLDKIVKTLKEKSIEFNFDYHINKGIIILRGLFINNKNGNDIKSLFDSYINKEFKFKKTLSWYLGDRKETLLLQLKKEMETSIPEIESYQVSNES
ncbi:MAG: hypothetical protein EHM58_18860 [Ignavibacteriae bacterium]|nr:MAG: hypothetical protein EHM58_18860 [Ignavibacteriota bacterium]